MSIPCKMRPAGLESLPVGYTRCNYLESSGTQWIDIGETLNHTCVVECVSQRLEAGAIYGSRTAHAVSEFILWAGCSTVRWGTAFNASVVIYNLNYNASPIIEDVVRTRHSSSIEINGVLVASAANPNQIWENNVNCYLFASHDGQNITYLGSNRILSFTLEKNGIACRNLIPCLDNTGTPCMFDLVTRKPFYNSGTGEFIVGIENQAQLNNLLRKLPDRTGQTAGTLQVRLADELQTPENEAKLDAMLAKNWEISQAA